MTSRQQVLKYLSITGMKTELKYCTHLIQLTIEWDTAQVSALI